MRKKNKHFLLLSMLKTVVLLIIIL